MRYSIGTHESIHLQTRSRKHVNVTLEDFKKKKKKEKKCRTKMACTLLKTNPDDDVLFFIKQ